MTMLEGLCPRGAKIFGAISLTPVVPAVCLGSLGPLQRRVRVLATMTTHHCFAKLSANLRFEFEILIWSTPLIESNSYHIIIIKALKYACTP